MSDPYKAKQAADKRDRAKQLEREKVKAEQKLSELERKARSRKTNAAGALLGAQDTHDLRVARNQQQAAKRIEEEQAELHSDIEQLNQDREQLEAEADQLNQEA